MDVLIALTSCEMRLGLYGLRMSLQGQGSVRRCIPCNRIVLPRDLGDNEIVALGDLDQREWAEM